MVFVVNKYILYFGQNRFLHVFGVFINKNTSKRGCFGLKKYYEKKKKKST